MPHLLLCMACLTALACTGLANAALAGAAWSCCRRGCLQVRSPHSGNSQPPPCQQMQLCQRTCGKSAHSALSWIATAGSKTPAPTLVVVSQRKSSGRLPTLLMIESHAPMCHQPLLVALLRASAHVFKQSLPTDHVTTAHLVSSVQLTYYWQMGPLPRGSRFYSSQAHMPSLDQPSGVWLDGVQGVVKAHGSSSVC